jgi:formate-dependent nitrite reductase cytochrome c552 subunit
MLTLTGCANTHNPLDDYEQVEPAAILDVPSANASVYPVEQVERGRYLVALLSCGSCHTDGVLQIDLLEIAEGARQAVCIRLRGTGKRAWVMR